MPSDEKSSGATPRGCVLIVEDNSFMKTFYQKALRDLPVEFHFAEDGEEAVRQAVDKRPALILMDINLPKMDGVAATIEIRSSAGFEEIVVIAVSARNQDAYTDSARFNEFVPKPVRVDQLREAVIKYLKI